MNLLAIYRTETDWCALVASRNEVSNQEQRITLTYASQPEEAQVLEDAEVALAAAESAELPPLMIDETASAGEKREQVLNQVAALSAFVKAHDEVFADAESIKAALANLAEKVG